MLPFTTQYWTELVISISSINKIALRIYSCWDQEILLQEILHLCSYICVIISFSILCWPLCRGERESFVKITILNRNGNLANGSKNFSVGRCALQLPSCQLQTSLWSSQLSTMCLIPNNGLSSQLPFLPHCYPPPTNHIICHMFRAQLFFSTLQDNL